MAKPHVFKNLCSRCGKYHVPAAMASEANADLKRRWGMTLQQVIESMQCSDFERLEGDAILHALQTEAERKQQSEGLQ